MLDSNKFISGFTLGAAFLGAGLLCVFALLSVAGELDLDSVVAKQQKNERSLFSSGLNQNSFKYKIKLMDAFLPEVVAIGSSRAMQVRGAYFSTGFVTLGGAVNHVSELEVMVDELVSRENKPKLAIFFADPWWFNKTYSGSGGAKPQRHQTIQFSLPLAVLALKRLENGNWISKLSNTNNSGIHAILTNEGFGSDGSYHHTNTINGINASFEDQGLANTLERVRAGDRRFEKGQQADIALLMRACTALNKAISQLDHVLVVAPPFAAVVWQEMVKGDYQYISDAYNKITECVGDKRFYSFISGELIPNGSDCEFLDGFHGGDVTYARMVSLIGENDERLNKYLDRQALGKFIAEGAGRAGPMTSQIYSVKEVDFLKIGCEK